MPNCALWIIARSDDLINPESFFKSFNAGDGARREYELNIK